MPPFVNEVNSSSQPMIEGTSVINNQLSPSLASVDHIPFDLVEEILCRLPVKFLLQLRCVCKSWNSLISHHKFAKKHLSMSTTRRLHIISYSKPLRRPVVNSCPRFRHCVH
ncbi:F-box/kelch-repeat protein [Trifolium repens]|nr:F-box/kelch-repeat protein [Trifolium repens]